MTGTPSNATPDRAWAGRVLFPRSAAELRSTTSCPACLTPLTAAVCRSCGLDLRHPASVELASSSAAIADALDARLDLIGRIRRETAAAAVAAPAAAAAQAAPPAPAEVAHPSPAGSAAAAPPPPGPPAAAGTARGAGPRRSGIQIALIVVGITLLSVFAVFGLVYAFVTYGSLVRMTIIVAGTLATMVAASVLARRGLGSTAEGVAALGVVMLLLDAWALRLNDPSGLGASPEALYWGIALLAIGATVALWSRVSRLSTPTVVGAGLLPLGAGLLALHLLREALPGIDGIDVTGASIVTLGGAAVAWFIAHPDRPATRRAARLLAQSVGAIAAAAALISLAGLQPEERFAPLVGGLVLAAVVVLHLVTTVPSTASPRRPLDTLLLVSISGGAVVAAIAGAVISALRFEQSRVVVSAPLLAAVAIAVLAEQGWRRVPADSAWRTAFSSATIVAAVHAAVAGGIAAIVGASAFGEAAIRGLHAVPLTVDGLVTSGDRTTVAALGALALSLGLIALGWAGLRVLRHRARALTLAAGIVLIAAVPLLGTWWLVMLVFSLLALGGAAGLHLVGRVAERDARRALFVLCVPLASGGALGAFLTSWAVPRGWAIGLLVALLAIGIARAASSHLAARASALGLAAALVIGCMPALGRDLTSSAPWLEVSAAGAMLLAAAVIIASSYLGRVTATERQVAGGVAVLGALLAQPFLVDSGIDGVIGLALLGGALSLVAVRAGLIERIVASALLPLVVGRGAVLLAEQLGLPSGEVAIVGLAALITVAAIALAADRPPAGRAPRIAGDVAAGLAALAILLPAAREELGWLLLILLAVLVLVIAISRDGLIGSASARRHLGWLSLAVATAALWLRLGEEGITEPEPYALPLAGALLIVAAANAVLSRRRGTPVAPTVGLLTAAALLVAILPTTLSSADGPAWRAIVVAALGVTLVLGALGARRAIEARAPTMAAALLGVGVLALGLLAAVLTIDIVDERRGLPATVESSVLGTLIVTVLSAVALGSWLLGEGRLRRVAVAGTIGTAGLSAGVLGASGAVEPVELITLPLALALLVIGELQLSTNAAARSWPWLAPGVGVLLIPSLLAIDGAGEPLWRAIALGLVAALVFVAALWRRLQAPFVIGGAVLLIHLLVQSWPLLDQVGRAIEWWLWLGLAGVIVVVIAARYERRLQNVRDLARRIAQLR